MNMTDPVMYGYKKNSYDYQQGRLRGVLPTFMHKFG